MCWALWLLRNDTVFNKETTNAFSQVFFRGSYWIQEWSQLSKEEEKTAMKSGCKKLEMVVLEFFISSVWRQHRSLEE